MDLESIIKEANPNLVIFLLTSIVGFIAWVVKSLIEKPINDSKNTFIKYFDKRIEILTEIKTRLNFIAYFPEGEDSLEFKNQLQKLLLSEGKAAYLSKEVYDKTLRISIDPTTNEKLLLETIKEIDEELYLKISKIQDEIRFYRKFSNFSPLKRFVSLTFLSFQYLISLLLIVLIIGFVIVVFINGDNYVKLIIVFLGIIGVFLINKWLKK